MADRPIIDGAVVTDDPIHHVLRAACWSIADRAHDDDLWDQAPALYTLVRTEPDRVREIYGDQLTAGEPSLDPEGLAAVTQALEGAPGTVAVGCIPVPVPESLWDSHHPHEVLDFLAVVMRGVQPPHGEPFGLIFCVEGWGVEADAENVIPDRIDEHPDRREIRATQAVDLAGARVSLHQFRGGDVTEPDEVADGTVFGQLETILQAMTDVDPDDE
jgi:hypothetical protein